MKDSLKRNPKPTPAPKPPKAVPALPASEKATPAPQKDEPVAQPGAYNPKPANAAYVLAEMLKLTRKR